MKTRNFIPTLLALTIRLMVCGQTGHPAEHRGLPVLVDDKIPSASLNKKQHQNEKTQKAQKVIHEFNSTNSQKKPTIVYEEKSTVATKQQAQEDIDNNTFNFFNDNNCYNTMVYAQQLIKQAENLNLVEITLRNEATRKSGEEKTGLLKSAGEIFIQAELKYIQASEIAGKVNLDKFNSNARMFKHLITTVNASDIVIQSAFDMGEDAKHQFKMAKELREESYALRNNSAKLGNLNNAEEKEIAALNKQDQAIGMLKQYAAFINETTMNDLAVK